MRGRPPAERSRLHLAVAMIRNGASVGDAAIWSGIHRNTLYRYGISKGAVKTLRDMFVIPPARRRQENPMAERVYEIERDIAASIRSAINVGRVPLIATAEAAQMESDRLQACVRAERLRNQARRLSRHHHAG